MAAWRSKSVAGEEIWGASFSDLRLSRGAPVSISGLLLGVPVEAWWQAKRAMKADDVYLTMSEPPCFVPVFERRSSIPNVTRRIAAE